MSRAIALVCFLGSLFCAAAQAQISDTTVTINSPGVNNPITEYPSITFQPGDQVYVTAGGCVQTGGSGSTWKRYVNPSGDNADRLYHGRIWIPGATMGLETIGSVINRSPVTVATPPPGANPSEMYLRLGYDDDVYADNGYWGHDDGTENQCLNVGNAWVTIRTVRYGGTGATRSCPSTIASNTRIDPFWNALDSNFLPLNPVWGDQCGQTATHVDVVAACGGSGAYVNSIHQPSATCTTFLTATDTKDIPFGIACNSPLGVNGHLNWGLATYTGTSYWQEYNGSDNDYNLLLKTPNDAGLTINNETVPYRGYPNPDAGTRAMQLEFSGIEVFRPGYLTSLWNSFANADSARIDLLERRPAIAIGLLNLDMVHDVATEIHPVLGLAVHTKSPARGDGEEVWMILSRNYGDQGGCSHSDLAYLHGFDAKDMRFSLPTAYATPSIDPLTSGFYTGNNIVSYSATAQASGGVLLTIPRTTPEGDRVLGEIHIRPAPRPTGDFMAPGEALLANQKKTSSDGRFQLIYQGDGNLVLYQIGLGALWASNTWGTSPGQAIMQGDGNLVVYDASGRALWASGTWGNPGSSLSVQSDGNVVVYRPAGPAIWATNTTYIAPPPQPPPPPPPPPPPTCRNCVIP